MLREIGREPQPDSGIRVLPVWDDMEDDVRVAIGIDQEIVLQKSVNAGLTQIPLDVCRCYAAGPEVDQQGPALVTLEIGKVSRRSTK